MEFLLGCSELKSSTLTNKFKGKNVFEYSLCDLELFCILFSDPVRCDWFFMEYLGFESDDSDERRIRKYQHWGGDILLTLLKCNYIHYEAYELGVDVLRRYNLLQHEISRTYDGMTLLQQAVFSVDYARLTVEAGFPECLLLHENDDNENVLDVSIRLNNSPTSRGQFQHLIGYFLEEKRDVFLGPNNLDKEKVKKYRRYLRKRKADVSTSDLRRQAKMD
ncbi:uncharacterized protein LOC142349598 [Convolutriloba macropyga]|uniref:uncharacterized protein LOC142349598 n=1 Tax=Convolutriloba macropyga TaxID=536237 RepID=UPI003F520B2A